MSAQLSRPLRRPSVSRLNPINRADSWWPPRKQTRPRAKTRRAIDDGKSPRLTTDDRRARGTQGLLGCPLFARNCRALRPPLRHRPARPLGGTANWRLTGSAAARRCALRSPMKFTHGR
ncbi:Hypothetical protein NTJ_02790 [Nesidiocoris tenuis]|uniref:Uncharacterized protein n=1 Tax=Nesidiocoris tenuis TaxID=355587 RepID=A0ABN7ACG4_9HEMI|nr:Hypothetical protein NTJ_02790 [Nesidiocoris tenuis]